MRNLEAVKIIMDSKGLIEVGNAADQGRTRGGWFIGHFVDRTLGLRH